MSTATPRVTPDAYLVDGKSYVRVTTLLRAVGAADFSEIPERDRDFYMDRGCEFHRMTQHVEEGVADQYAYDPRVEVYRPAHARFLRETGFRALPGGTELFVCRPWSHFGLPDREVVGHVGLAGTLDRLGTIQNRVVLMDYKLTQVRASTALQTSLYLLMLNYAFAEVERYGVAFRNDGTYRMSPKYPLSDRNDALYHIHRFIEENTHDAH